MLTAFAALGGVGSAQSAISAVQGQYGKKVTICHKGKTITVSKKALPAHLRHGDTVGTCAEAKAKKAKIAKAKAAKAKAAKAKAASKAQGQGDKAKAEKPSAEKSQAQKGEDKPAQDKPGKGKGRGEVTLQPVTEGPAGGRAPRSASTRASGSGGRTTCPGPRPGSSPAACRTGRTAHRRARTP